MSWNLNWSCCEIEHAWVPVYPYSLASRLSVSKRLRHVRAPHCIFRCRPLSDSSRNFRMVGPHDALRKESYGLTDFSETVKVPSEKPPPSIPSAS